jgi:hypothetical protein
METLRTIKQIAAFKQGKIGGFLLKHLGLLPIIPSDTREVTLGRDHNIDDTLPSLRLQDVRGFRCRQRGEGIRVFQADLSAPHIPGLPDKDGRSGNVLYLRGVIHRQ